MLSAATSAQTLMFGYDPLGRLTSEPAVMGSFTYGPGTVHDRGGAIRGNHIDVWFPTERQAINWGNPHLDVEVCR
jgi:3D (Asp-Asp-Asp) domain-containing protein